MGIKQTITDKVLQWILESKVSPLKWLDGWKTVIGNVLTIISTALLGVQQWLCPGWEYCEQLDAANVFILWLMSLLVKFVGEWHKKDKALRGV